MSTFAPSPNPKTWAHHMHKFASGCLTASYLRDEKMTPRLMDDIKLLEALACTGSSQPCHNCPMINETPK
jgi:hypothetical protein